MVVDEVATGEEVVVAGRSPVTRAAAPDTVVDVARAVRAPGANVGVVAWTSAAAGNCGAVVADGSSDVVTAGTAVVVVDVVVDVVATVVDVVVDVVVVDADVVVVVAAEVVPDCAVEADPAPTLFSARRRIE